MLCHLLSLSKLVQAALNVPVCTHYGLVRVPDSEGDLERMEVTQRAVTKSISRFKTDLYRAN